MDDMNAREMIEAEKQIRLDERSRMIENRESSGVQIEKLGTEGDLICIYVKDPGPDFEYGIFDLKKLRALEA